MAAFTGPHHARSRAPRLTGRQGSTGALINVTSSYTVSNPGELTGTSYGFYQIGAGGGTFTNTGHVAGAFEALHFGTGVDHVINLSCHIPPSSMAVF